jgi:hypothetical protein
MMPNVIPDKITLINKIKENIPAELLYQPIWLAYYYKQNKDGTLTKPPCSRRGHTVSDDSPGVSFDEAVQDGYPGIKINGHTNLIAFDIDDKDAKLGKRAFELTNMSQEFRNFVIEQDSYMEYSPSGCGLRILMICDDKTDLPGRVNLLKDKCIGGELFINSGYVTITGEQISGTRINNISPGELKEWYIPKKAEVIDLPVENFKFPEISLVLKALQLCKLDQCNRVKEAYQTITKQDYNHYDYWLKIMSSCHHYATVTNQLAEMTSAVVVWSQTDEESYESDEDVINHWASLSNTKQSITYSTLFKFAKLLKFEWPNEIHDKNGPTGKPMVNSPVNFRYLMEYFNIKFCRDIFNGNSYVKTSKEIIDQFFLPFEEANIYFGMAGPYSEENLNGIMWDLANENGYTNVALGPIVQLLTHHIQRYSKRTNILKLWLDTSPDELPDDMIEKNTDISKSNLDYLMSCFKLRSTQSEELAKMYFNTFFFEMVMPIYNPKRILSQRSFMLVLTGPEACRKTTFFSMLFPNNLRSNFVTNSTETLGGAKSIRDFSTSLVTSALVVTDEFEIFYNKKNDSLFKTLVTSDVIDYVPIYEKTMKKEHKNAVLAGTTNKRSLPFEQDTNRRLAIIDVEWIDTNAMMKINWHYFYRQYIAEGKKAMMNGLFPWKLSNEAIQKQYEVNEQFRAQTNLEIVMKEVFDFDMEAHKEMIYYDRPGVQTNDKLLKINEVIGAIKQRYPDIHTNPAELKHLLKRLCGKYTSTTNKRI